MCRKRKPTRLFLLKYKTVFLTPHNGESRHRTHRINSVYIYTARSNASRAFINLVLLHTFRYKSMCEYKCVRVRQFVQLATNAWGRPERYYYTLPSIYHRTMTETCVHELYK